MALLTTRQAAHRLGVKPQTLYAYVSRGLLHSHRSPDGRTSRFDTREVDELARRGRPREHSRERSLEIEIATRITCIEQDRVSFRGRDAADLARRCTFEQVAELLWTDALSDEVPRWSGTAVPAEGPAMVDRLRTIAAHAAAVRHAEGPPFRIGGTGDGAAEAVTVEGRWLIATLVDSLPPAGDGRCPRLVLDGAPVRGTIAGRLWARLTRQRARPGYVAALNAALILLADHEMATSTLAARVAASGRSDPHAVVSAGLGALAGSLHGGVSRRVRTLLDGALSDGVAPAVDRQLERHGTLSGFGHLVYTGADPRAVTLLELLAPVLSPRHAELVATTLAEADRRGQPPMNVDFALGVLGLACGMPADAGETIFATARISGWLAHALEEYGERPLRFRPRAVYVGPPPGNRGRA